MSGWDIIPEAIEDARKNAKSLVGRMLTQVRGG